MAKKKVKTKIPIEVSLSYRDYDNRGAVRYHITAVTDWAKPDIDVFVFEKDGIFLVRWLNPENPPDLDVDVYEGDREGMYRKFPWLKAVLGGK